MLISLSKDASSQPGDILAHVEISASNDPTKLEYSHSFRYKIPLGKDGKIVVYANEEAASKDVKGDVFSFDFEICNNLDCHKMHCQTKHKHCKKKVKNCQDCEKEIKRCKKTNKHKCPDIAGKRNRPLVASIFHTLPTWNTLHYFGTALFKALFNVTGRQLQSTQLQSTRQNDPIFLQLNDHDLDAIPWEYAKNGMVFLVHSHMFARVLASPLTRPQNKLPELPLRIIVAAPDPLDLTELKLADLHLGDQFQNLINEFHGNSIKIMLERVLPATVNKMNLLLAKHYDKMATVFHFMGHCVSHNNGARGLLFEHKETFKSMIAHTENLVNNPAKLRLAFLSACNSREVARDLAQNGVRHTIGSYCSLPDDIARKSEVQFYHYLAQGLSVDMAMWQMRKEFQNNKEFQYNKELQQSNYLAGAMILYSTTCQIADNVFLCEPGSPIIGQNMFPSNIKMKFTQEDFFGRKKELADLSSILRKMVTYTNDSFNVCTITGIGGQGKTALAREIIHRISHFFPGGIFAWKFDDKQEISAKDYLWNLAKVLFPDNALNDADEVEKLGQVISNQFQASSLLFLDHADILKHAVTKNKKDAIFLEDWLQRNISRKDIAVKILATSWNNLGWFKETLFPLDNFISLDIHSGCKLFVENLSSEAKMRMAKEKNSNHLLHKLLTYVDGHPLSLKLLARAASLKKHLDKSLNDIVYKYHSTMLADINHTNKSLENCFGSMIDELPELQRQILYLCCLFTGSITDRILLFISHFLNCSIDDFSAETIAVQLQTLCKRGLLKLMEDDSYSIHVALRVAASQRNTDMYLCLHLQISDNYADTFIVGVLTCSPSRKSIVLQWLFDKLKSNHTSHLKTKNLGIEYYSLKNTSWTTISHANIDCNLAEATRQQKIPTQLIVFIYKTSEIFCNSIYQLYEDKISLIVTERKLPFIVCCIYDYTLDEISSKKSKLVAQMKKVAENLQMSLVERYKIAVTENLSEKNNTNRKSSTAIIKSDNLDSKRALRDYRKSLTDVYMEGNFVGRENELERLHILLNDDTHHYVTIKGFGGIGKTCLAIQAAKDFNSGSILALSLIGTPTLSSVIGKIARFLGIETKEMEPQEQQIVVIEKLDVKENILLYLDNMEDIKNMSDEGGNIEAKDLMKFFRRMPKNVKILATSRVALGWPNEEIVELYGLAPPDGINVFRQWSSQREGEIDDDSALKLSELVHGHPLSVRLLGGVFNNSDEPINEFLNNIYNRLSTAVDNNSTVDYHKSINACIEYSFKKLDPTLRSFLGQLKSFEIPFCNTIAVRALGLDTTLPSASLIANNLYKLWQSSWLNRRKYQEDPMLGDWRPRAIEEDTKFYSLHPRLCDFLNEQSKNIEDDSSAMLNDCEIQFYTALCYGVGFGVVNNLDKQIEWCKKAANNEHLEAQLILAVCYNTGGGGVGEDQEKASYWYLKAAEAGDMEAQAEMMHRFYNGMGAKKDKNKASYWRELFFNNNTTPLKIKFDLSLPLVHRATEYGAMDLVRSLMEQRLAKVDIKDRNGRTPLHKAAEKGHINIFQLLSLEFGAEINATKKDGVTPLHLAAENGHINVIKLLAELGVNFNAKDEEGGTPFHWAAKAGHIKVMSILENELKADANVEDNKKQTPLHWAVKSGQIEALKFLLPKVHSTKLSFQGNNIVAEGIRALVELLKQNTTLTWLNLRDISIGPEGARALGESLKQNTTLTQLNLEWNDIDDSGARALGESLKQNTTLTQLNLLGNDIGAKGARALGESLKQNTTLTQLSLSRNHIDAEGARALGESLKQNTTLTQLSLSRNHIGAEGARALGESLKQNTTLTQLNLLGNGIGDSGARALGESLKQNTTLTQLNLYRNDIGDSGARALGESLKQNTTLTQLNLECNSIGAEGARALGESLKQNTTLTQLNLEWNHIGAEGARALGESLKQNTTLTQLNLLGNDIGDSGARALGESLKQNTTLTQLNLSRNDIGDSGARALGESLKQNTTLTQLNLLDFR